MNARSELRLRDVLLELTRAPQSLDSRLDEVLTLRYPANEPILNPLVADRHIEAIRNRLSTRSNGVAPAWFRRPPARNLWPALAIGAVVVILLLMMLLRPKVNPRNIVKNPPSPKPDIRLVIPKGPVEKKAPKEEHIVKHTPKPSEKLPPNTAPRINRMVKHTTPGGVKYGPEAPKAVARIPIGTFGKVQGEPTYRLPGETKDSKVLPNQPLYAHATIQTGDMDKAEIKFTDGTTVSMDFNTTLVLPEMGPIGPISRPQQIGLTSGKVYVHVVHHDQAAGEQKSAAIDTASRKPVVVAGLPNAVPFSVRTPVATAKVVGTKFTLELQRKTELKAILQVREGKVEFFNEHGVVTATEKTESTATKDSKPTEPRRLSVLSITQDPVVGRRTTWTTSRLNSRGAMLLYAYPYGTAGFGSRATGDGRVHITWVEPGGPADLAGLKAGDLLTKVDGLPVLNNTQIALTVSERPGRHLKLNLDRDGNPIEVSLSTVGDYNTTSYPASLPQPIATNVRTATWLAISGQTDKALERLVALVHKFPNAPSYNNIGIIYETRDQMQDAIRNFQVAIRLDGRNWKYHSCLAYALRQIGNFDRAAEEYERAYSLEPANSWMLFSQVGIASIRGDQMQALSLLDAQSARWGTHPDYWRERADILAHQGKFAEAVKAGRRAIELDPWNSNFHFGLGNNLYGLWMVTDVNRAQVLTEVEVEFRKAIDLDPGRDMAHGGLGDILSHTGRLAEAESEYRTAVRLNPDNVFDHAKLGTFLFRQGRLSEAETEIRKALGLLGPQIERSAKRTSADKSRSGKADGLNTGPLDIDEKNADNYWILAQIYLGQNRLVELQRILKGIAMVAPKRPDWFLLGNAVAQSPPDETDELSRVILSALPDDPDQLNMFSFGIVENEKLALSQPKLQAAMHAAERSVALLSKQRGTIPNKRLDYSLGAVLDTLGWIRYKMGRHEQAAKDLERAVELIPDDIQTWEVFVHIALNFQKMNREDKVAEAFQQAEAALKKNVEKMPKNWFFHYQLGILYERMHEVGKAKDAYPKSLKLDPDNKEVPEALKRLGE